MGKEAALRSGFRGFGPPAAGWFSGFKGWWWRPGAQIFKKRHRCRRRLCRMVMFASLKGKGS